MCLRCFACDSWHCIIVFRLIDWFIHSFLFFFFFFFIGKLHSGALPNLPHWRLDAKRPYLCAMWTLKCIIDCPQPGSSRVTYKPPPIGNWPKCGGNDTVMVVMSLVQTSHNHRHRSYKNGNGDCKKGLICCVLVCAVLRSKLLHCCVGNSVMSWIEGEETPQSAL